MDSHGDDSKSRVLWARILYIGEEIKVSESIMGDHQAFERYYWFDNQIKADTFPNANSLAEKFECDKKTAQRAIDLMRDRLNAPLNYDAVKHGYIYTDNSFELPRLQVSQEELLSILLAQNILSQSAGGTISALIKRFGKRLFVKMGNLGLDEQRMYEAFSAKWNEYAPVEGFVFQKVTKALLENQVLEFSYTSPRDQQTNHRAVEPHHLQHYMGSWTLIGFCRLRKGWRKFMLSRMTELTLTKEVFKPQPKSAWQNQLDGGFGIFQGGELTTVKLHFNPFRAAWIREQIWHPQQAITLLADGSLDMTFPVYKFYEVKMKILQFGGDVEVMEPLALRDEIKIEIDKMAGIYR
jgi:predicted DNA-binding transcriptional regulator YafY